MNNKLNIKIVNIICKLRRSFNMLIDKSEVFKDNPTFRIKIIKNIWNNNL